MTRTEYFREYYRRKKARPPTRRACPVCGTSFAGTARKVYCSTTCRVPSVELLSTTQTSPSMFCTARRTESKACSRKYLTL